MDARTDRIEGQNSNGPMKDMLNFVQFKCPKIGTTFFHYSALLKFVSDVLVPQKGD